MTSSTVTILLVEDNPVDVEAVLRAFQEHRIANPVVHAQDGREALEMLRASDGAPRVPRPVIVLLDLNMPRMNGLEFLEALRSDPELSRTVVFVLTTSKRDEDIVSAYAQHVAGYILKSEVGDRFVGLVTLLRAYWRVVELPDG